MKEKIKQITILATLILFLIMPYFVFAAPSMKSVLQGLGDSAGYQTGSVDQTSMSSFLGLIINVLLSLLGIIFIILMIYAGYNWMTASGDQGKVDKAKETIWRAVIGLIIVVGAYAIWTFIFFKLFS